MALLVSSNIANAHGFDVLVFTKTAGSTHASIPDGVTAIQELGVSHDFSTTVTDDAATFIAALPTHNVVVFLNTTGDVFNSSQEAAFQSWYQSGRGYVGIHAASDTEHDWAWYQSLVGAEFTSHSAVVEAEVKFLDQVHPITNITNPATSQRVETWLTTDEWYNFTSSPRGDVHVLAIVDEDTYIGGSHGGDHPIAWCQEFDNGRSAYLAMGHTSESYSDPIFRDLIVNAIEWAAGELGGDSMATIDSNYQVQTLDSFSNPMAIDIDDNGNVYVVERNSGALKKYDITTSQTATLDTISVYSGGEFGMLGIALAPDFLTSNHLYLFYTLPQAGGNVRLSRYTLTGSGLTDERVILEYPVLRPDTVSGNGHHQGGCLRFDNDGNLLLSTGDNTDASGYAPRNNSRPIKDARKASPNTNDLRGGIIRITPNVGGGPAAHPNYTIPPGNLFPATTSTERAEIYVMGARNPFRFCIDPHTNWLYFGDVGPDANNDGTGSFQGPAGHDEFNQVREAGNYGWPYYIGFNRAYRDGSGNEWNQTTIAADLTSYFASNGITAETTLPSPQPAWITYTYFNHLGFPEIRKTAEGVREGRAAMAGAVYQWKPGAGANAFPRYHDKTVFLFDFARNLIAEAKTDSDGNLFDLKRFLPGLGMSGPLDMMFGPDGRLYYIDLYSGNLRRISYSVGNLQPTAVASSNIDSGSLPLTVQFSSSGSVDQEDGITLSYLWDFGDGSPNSTAANPTYEYTTAGTYNVQLTVTDSDGLSATANLTISAGNSAPSIAFTTPPNNSFYDWGDMVSFDITVTDPEDGSSTGGQITDSDVLYEGSLGHIAHQHNEKQFNSLGDTVEIERDPGHGFDDDLYYVFDAYYTDQGATGVDPIQAQATSVLLPKLLMAQFFDNSQGVTIQATADLLGGVEDVAGVDNGDWIMFEALNLYRINAIRLRAASTNGCQVEVRTGSPTGTLLGTINVAATGGNDNYQDFTVSVTDPSVAVDLYFVFVNASQPTDIVRLNWIGFRGQGVTTTPERPEMTAANVIGNNLINLRFNQTMDYATLMNPANYQIDGSATVNSVSVTADQLSATLQTSGLVSGNYFQLTVSNCEDLAGDAISDTEITLLHHALQEEFFLGINSGGSYYVDVDGKAWLGEVTGSDSDLLINADFNDSSPSNHTGAAVIGNSGDDWNYVEFNSGWTSVTATNLQNASGTTTSVSMNLSSYNSSGAVLASTVFEQPNVPSDDLATSIQQLTRDYPYLFNTNASGSQSSNAGAYWTLEFMGLETNGLYNLYLISSGDAPTQGARFTLDGVTKSTINTTLNRTTPVAGEDYVLYENVDAGADGTIQVRVQNNLAGNHTFNLAGFQLQAIGPNTAPVVYYDSSNTYSTSDSVANTSDDTLYQTERWKDGDLEYSIPIDSGTYDVTLKFAEIFHTSNGTRTLNVQVEGGSNVFSPDLDIHAQVGHDAAWDYVINDVTVTDGFLNILFTQSSDNPKVAAIGIERPPLSSIPSPSFAAFMGDNFSHPVSIEQDDENDGISLLLEYALGALPTNSDSSDTLPALLDGVGSDFDFTFDRPIGLPDVSYNVYASVDLNLWVPLVITPVTSSSDPGMETVTYQNLEAAAANAGLEVGDGRYFFRLDVRLTEVTE
ncbi:ThuA domain-containing protein [Rubellicoccus peritrichatus]|uniref:ThuA domain-containing protein n=1 Tax=Rubellicoccus peritrichatus TaxID=3080537 RepID=A0AAQ3LJZ3_9BACT|nr:ThuA domain-containing protein [Puniceicoccus sp. CR14]WOO43654.1 ThuA domain-containing protein [Puniceicoccus sp. CR14]